MLNILVHAFCWACTYLLLFSRNGITGPESIDCSKYCHQLPKYLYQFTFPSIVQGSSKALSPLKCVPCWSPQRHLRCRHWTWPPAGRAHALTGYLHCVGVSAHSGSWETLTRVKIRAGEPCALCGWESRFGDSRNAVILRLCPWLSGLCLASAAPHENNRFGTCLAETWSLTFPREEEKAVLVPPVSPREEWSPLAVQPLGSFCFSGLVHSLITHAHPHHPQPPFLLFSKTGIILHIFFPSPKIGKRREQLIWSSCWFCYLTKIFFFFLQ